MHAAGGSQFEGLERMVRHARAMEVVSWAMPLVSHERLLSAALECGMSGDNQIVYWSSKFGWKNQELTPNPDTVYIQSFMNTREVGPVVVEIPAARGPRSLNGSICNAWQDAIEDIGPAGYDAGRGGRYLILPPGYNGEIPLGYNALWNNTYRSLFLIRSTLADGSPEDIRSAIEYAKEVKVYPLREGKTTTNVWTDLIDQIYDPTIPYDHTFFERFNAIYQGEIQLERDRVMIDLLATLGIRRGQEFTPSDEDLALLDEAAKDAFGWLDGKYAAMYEGNPFFPGTHWKLPVDPQLVQVNQQFYRDGNTYPIDARGVGFSFFWWSAHRLGAGQYYLCSIYDAAGDPLNGSKQYTLHLPAEVPVTQYWSISLYDRKTHALIPETSRSSLSSTTPGLLANEDGSIDLYFGPSAPEGKASNWVPTDRARNWETMFRYYGPEPALFDGSWRMPDIEILT